MEEQFQFIMAECGLTYPEDVPWIEGPCHWHKRMAGIDALGRLDQASKWTLPDRDPRCREEYGWIRNAGRSRGGLR
jgi:hypothetical protein